MEESNDKKALMRKETSREDFVRETLRLTKSLGYRVLISFNNISTRGAELLKRAQNR